MKALSYYRDVCDPAGYLARLGGSVPPIFIFHDVEPRRFDRQLQALKSRGLRGVSCADVDWAKPDPRDVVLTFDDGRATLYKVAFPLLLRHGFRATAFVSPGLIAPRLTGPSAPNEGRLRAAARLIDWQQAREMQCKGTIDLQLHGFAHARVFVSARIVDFVRPGRHDGNLGISAWRVRRNGRETCEVELAPGEPVYEYGSRWGPRPRFLDSEHVREACRRRVEEGDGSTQFFARPDWRSELEATAREARVRCAASERWETAAERDADLRCMLGDAHAQLRAETGVVATHFALPWAEDGRGVEQAALACGIEHLHCGYLSPAERARWGGGRLRRHPRLKEFFLDRLPGAGRPSLPRFLLREIRRIAAQDDESQSFRHDASRSSVRPEPNR